MKVHSGHDFPIVFLDGDDASHQHFGITRKTEGILQYCNQTEQKYLSG